MLLKPKTPHLTYLKIININASKIKEETIPAEVMIKLFLIKCPSSCFFKIDKSFIDNTGKTQGIMFNIKPPIKAIKRKRINELF